MTWSPDWRLMQESNPAASTQALVRGVALNPWDSQIHGLNSGCAPKRPLTWWVPSAICARRSVGIRHADKVTAVENTILALDDSRLSTGSVHTDKATVDCVKSV